MHYNWKSMLTYEFEYFVQKFIDEISGEGVEFNETFYRKIFNSAFEEAERDIRGIITNIRYDIEKGFHRYKQEVAEKMVEDWSKYYWQKFQDGHDFEEGMKAVCYFKQEDEYRIGTAIRLKGQEGLTFIFENEGLKDPDYISPLYPYMDDDLKTQKQS